MKTKKHWYDYLWIAELIYFSLGFFNILFAWVGLCMFFIPLVLALAGWDKAYCNRYCGRGQLFALLGGRLKLSRYRDVPGWLRSRFFRYGFLVAGLASLPFLPLRFPGVFHGHVLQHASRDVACV